MKVYIALEEGYDHREILGVFAHHHDAKRLADKRGEEIQAEWDEMWGENSRYYNPYMLASDPHDTTRVAEYEVQ